jgi:integrase
LVFIGHAGECRRRPGVSRPQKPYQLLRRKAKSSKYVYYVSFHLPDGSLTSPRSSGQTSKGAAENWAIEQINQGKIPAQNLAGNKREELVAFLLDFWDYDNSKYVRGRIARGGTISRAHCKNMGYMITKFVKPTFEGRSIRSLTPEDFEEWMASLAKEDVPHRSINGSRQCINVGLNYLTSLRRIPWNPLAGVKPYSEVNGKRGTLTVEEFRKLLDYGGLDPRVHASIALGGLCGIRMGEIRGLRWGDVDITAKRAHIHTSFVEIDGERDQAKHGSNRDVPLPAAVIEALEDWRSQSPATTAKDWIVCDLVHPDQPMLSYIIRDAFDAALEGIGITDRKDRRIVFHSLGH